MNSWPLSRRLLAGFGSLVVIVALVAGSFELSLRVVNAYIGAITQNNIPGLITSTEALQNALNYRVLTLRHLLTTNPDEWKSIDAECDALAQTTLENFAIHELTLNSAEERELFAKIGPAFENYRTVARDMRQLNASGDHAGAVALATIAGTSFAAYEKAVIALASLNEKVSRENATKITAAMTRSRTLAAVLAVFGLATAIGACIFITRRINRAIGTVAETLNESSTQVAAAAAQVSSASHTLAQGASEQASNLEETSASLEEMASMTKRNAENAQQAKELSAETRASADTGVKHMDEMRRAMDAIKASSDDIAKIIKTIDEIAFQTNILALNAAVEAARAGEAGAGFAVVADEVRNLARRSAQSAKETAEKIEDAIRKSEHGVTISGSVAQSLSDIVEKARRVDALVAEIAQASKEQSQGITSLNSAMAQMDRVTQSNASNAEETAAAAEELTAQAASMRTAVASLEALLHGAHAKSASTTSAAYEQMLHIDDANDADRSPAETSFPDSDTAKPTGSFLARTPEKLKLEDSEPLAGTKR